MTRSRMLKQRAALSSHDSATPTNLELQITYYKIDELKPNPKNPRKHPRRQLRLLAENMKQHGFVVPVIVDADLTVICGHARLESAGIAGISRIPTVRLSHLSDAQLKALMIADNWLPGLAMYDEIKLGELLIELSAPDLNLDLEASTGLSSGERSFYIDRPSTEASDDPDPADNPPPENHGVTVSKVGDLWLLANRHRLLCGNALEASSFTALMAGHKSDVVFTDHPYNVRVSGNVSGLGAVKHREFVMASGEMTDAEYQRFLNGTCKLIASHCKDGAIVFLCIDYRHLAQMFEAGRLAFNELKNLCVWVKHPGMGSLYRSSHELIVVYKNGTARHTNNVELGKHQRNRTNVWSYPSINNFGRGGEEGNLLHLHPTVKPVRMIADAILDCSNRGDIVLDPFAGSGSTVIAAERTGRRCFTMELDPRYVDTVIRRFQEYTREAVVHAATGRTFDDIAAEVSNAE